MRRFLKRFAIVLSIVAFLGVTSGCGTIKGIGNDFKKAGSGVKKLVTRGEKAPEQKTE